MTETEFKVLFPDGPCTDVCLDFLRFKRGLGQKFAGSDIYRLRDICCQMNQAVGEAPALSKETALDIGELELDLYTALPIIAAYAGHTNIKDTERYIHLPEFDFSNIIVAGASVVDTCVPEV
ncbi:MAG: hypothetical protein PHI24_14085, partial [Desulfitobacteriaceae bacterium]|nr:hypothetical protein [Desulfitobacteriaceae bacterium]